MQFPFWIVAAVLATVGNVAAQPPASSPAPVRNVGELVARAGRYVVDYGEKMSLVVGVEHCRQWMRSGGATEPVMRVLVSEFALLRVGDDWVGFRDVLEVDGTAVEDRRDRILTLLHNRSNEGLLEGRRIADESARYNLGAVQRNFNTPTIALFFLHPKNQERFRYTKSGEDTIDGTRVWSVKYKETAGPTIVRTTTGHDVPASGMFWIDPVSGRVFRTRMDLRTEIQRTAAVDPPGGDPSSYPRSPKGTGDRPLAGPSGSNAPIQATVGIIVSYKPDARFGVPLPSEMRESYEVAPAHPATSPEAPTTITCVATYSDFRTFETFGRLIVR